MIYIHIPFCVRKCSYCGFYSHIGGNRQDLVDALCNEIRMRASEMWDRRHRVKTVYFGGGTPSVLSIAQIEQILEQLHRSFNLSEVVECTIETNPENLTPEYTHSLRRMGFVNRVSIGIQSFNNADLKLLNRRHSGEQALEAIDRICDTGFRNVSVDLIYGIPGQSMAVWLDNLEKCNKTGIRHLSCYSLTVEPNTILERQLSKGAITMPGDDDVISRYLALQEWCESNGFSQYEISNYCREPYRSRHNRRYWDRTPYMGFGPAAHSFDGKRRRWNIPDTAKYIAAISDGKTYHESETLSETDAYNEYVMTALRTIDGIDKSRIDVRFNRHLERCIKKYLDIAYIEDLDGHYRPTAQGLLHADGIAADLFFA